MKVVIIGGGFCGSLAAKYLDAKAEVVLIDRKDYFEFSPSIHKVVFNPAHFKKIAIPFNRFLKRTRIITDKLLRVTPIYVETEKEKIEFDYLIIASGIDYPVLLDDKTDVHALKSGKDALAIGDAVKKAEHILIVGGGLIGTEIAGELATKANKRVVIVHPKDRLLERNPESASNYAMKFLEQRGVNIIFGEKVVSRQGHSFITDKGRKIDAELALWCAGIKCNPWFMESFPVHIFTERKSLKVNEFLQLAGFSNIFVGGDINDVKEEKTAQNAERHAKLICQNIERSQRDIALKAHKPRSGPLVISLGSKAATMVLPNNWVINGVLPGLLKHMIEFKALLKYK